MKKLLLVSIVLLLTLTAYGSSTSKSTVKEKGISLGIIIDTSPSNQKTWNMFQAAILEMVYQLRAGDKITVYTAHPGKPRLRIVRVIGPNDKYNPSDIVRGTMSFSRELLSGANLSRAIELVFEDFYRETNQYQHCLAVISKGNINSGNVEQIKRLVVNYKNNDWPVRFICEETQASRGVLVNANNQQLDLRMLDKPELTEWITEARKMGEKQVTPAIDIPTPTVKVIEETKPIQDSDEGKSEASNDETVKVEIINLSRFPLNNPIVDNPNATKDKEPAIEEIANFKKTSVWARLKKSKWLLWIGLLSGTVVVGVLLCSIVKHITTQVSEDQIDGDEDFQQRLIGFIGQDRHDLGDIATLGEVVIGRGMGSSVFIDGEDIEERHIRIFKSGRKIKVQNLATTAISIDGVQLNRKQKAELFFPAEIELAGNVAVILNTEDINLNDNESGDSNEEQSI